MNVVLNLIWVLFGGIMIAIEYAISSIQLRVPPPVTPADLACHTALLGAHRSPCAIRSGNTQ